MIRSLELGLCIIETFAHLFSFCSESLMGCMISIIEKFRLNVESNHKIVANRVSRKRSLA